MSYGMNGWNKNKPGGDLISREEAIYALGERPLVWNDSDYDLGARAQYDYDVLALKELPSAQQERKKGRWIDITKCGGAPLYKCSECGDLVFDESYYCPNCGADMKETWEDKK